MKKRKSNIRVLVACEESQRVTKAFRKQGFKAYSCDLLPCSGGEPQWHLRRDAIKEAYSGKYDLMVAHPPCKYLTVTGNKWMKPEFRKRFPDRLKRRNDAIRFFKKLYHAPIRHIAIENPVGIMSTAFRKPNQYVQPYHFGDQERKKTGWWLKRLPVLEPTKVVSPKLIRMGDGKLYPKWHAETSKLPVQERSIARSRTFNGMAKAIAKQWGAYILQ